MKSLQEMLEGAGLRPSYQRLKILEYLAGSKEHPTVEMIYGGLKKEIPTISKTTIYNTLNAFVEKGLARAVTISGQELRYDFDVSEHSHFLCKKCGRVTDVYGVKLPSTKGRAEGNIVEEVHLYLKGICRECLNKLKEV